MRDRMEDKGIAIIREIRRLLYARQEVVCSYREPQITFRLIEKEINMLISNDPIARQLNMQADLTKYFQRQVDFSRSPIDDCVADLQTKLKRLLQNQQK